MNIKLFVLTTILAATLTVEYTSEPNALEFEFVSPGLPLVYVEVQELEELSYLKISSKNYNKDNRYCLSLNIYHEAKNQDIAGQIAVGLVTINRVVSKRFPNTICEVVKQAKTWKGNPIRNKCQFSFWCDGKSDKPYDKAAWSLAQQISTGLLNNWAEVYDITEGAMWYHAKYVTPYWISDFKKVAVIGDHVFYKN